MKNNSARTELKDGYKWPRHADKNKSKSLRQRNS
jgi:hypothetical protein